MQKRPTLLITLLIILSQTISAQDNLTADSSNRSATSGRRQVYQVKPALDIPLTLAGDGWSLYGMSVIYGRDPIPEAEINGLDRNTVNKIDRWVTYNYSEKAASASDKFFYGSMPLPLLLMLDKNIRRDGLKIGLLYLEAMGTTGTLYVSSAMLADRHRPYTYNGDAPMGIRTRGGARNSFFAGHVGIVATSVFFTAQVYADYHPEMKHKWVLYTGAGLLAGATGYLRIKAGQHFLTDVVTGLTVGSLSGILVPYLHKVKALKTNSRLTILPNIRQHSNGFTFLYKLDKKQATNTRLLAAIKGS